MEGIVLKSVDFKERERIVTVITLHLGLISLMIHGISKKNARLLQLSSPLTHIEFEAERKRGNLYHFKEGHLIDAFPKLRQNFEKLDAAGKMTRQILLSQLQEKPSPLLFSLFQTYLKQLPFFSDPTLLGSSFTLKLLIHEGLLSLDPFCAFCRVALPRENIFVSGGQLFCKNCMPASKIAFSSSEWDIIVKLGQAKQFKDFKEMQVSEQLNIKIHALFEEINDGQV